jgi:hypothetical protein
MSKARTPNIAKRDSLNIPVKRIELLKQQIFAVRGERVMLDHDLARLYGVSTKHLNQQLKRNTSRFPKDFAFQLIFQEAKQIATSRSQIVTLKKGQNIKYRPHVFTEHGAIMLATVLNSRIAVKASIYVVRAFVQMRATLAEYAGLSRRIDVLEAKYDGRFKAVFDAIRELMMLPARPQRRIGFVEASKRHKK